MAKKRKRADGIYKHASGQWAKTLNRKTVYLGKGTAKDAKAKLDLIVARDTLGQPEPVTESITVEQLSRLYLASKKHQVKAGRLAARTLKGLEWELQWLCSQIGRKQAKLLKGYDFTRLMESIPADMAPNSINTRVQRVRGLFKWGVDQEIIDRQPKYGDFRRVSALQERRGRSESESRVFTQDEVQGLLNEASGPWKAMILVGLNCAMDGASIGRLKWSDISHEWLCQTRGKTGIQRTSWLWPETRKAMEEARADDEFVFVNKLGRPFDVIERPQSITNSFGRIRQRAGIGRDIGFHGLRRTFATVARYLPANDRTIREVMAHAHDDILHSHYIEGIDRSEIRKLCKGVRHWMYEPRSWEHWRKLKSGAFENWTDGADEDDTPFQAALKLIEDGYQFLR